MKRIFTLLILLFSFGIKSNAQCIGTAGEVKWNYWHNFASTPDSANLMVVDNFPSRPDGSRTLGNLKSPSNFTDYYASYIRGYIKVPTTQSYEFNVTGDDDVVFYLSNNQSTSNLRKLAYVDGYTNENQHNKYASQKSVPTTLTANQYYYFETYHFEGSGGDHLAVYWRKTNDADTTWKLIDFNYLYDYACGQVCPPKGTSCNDGDASTSDDQQDGFCNCVGKKVTANTCVGARGVAEAYYYDNIPGSYVENDLIDAPKFPLVPDRKELLEGAYGALQRQVNTNYGTLVQGYLTVPATGVYEFNLTGDDQTIFYLSSDDNIANKQSHQAVVFWGVDYAEHNRFSFQNIGPLTLEKGKYYYYEFRHKQSGWRDHFTLHWKTPYHEKRSWKKVPSFYLYDYSCELSCIAQNTLCDDGNPFTKNDKYDANCNCVGTPCSGPDCDDAEARYTKFESCAPTNSVSTLEESSWQSCAGGAANPNPARSGVNRWIKYDFGDRYKFNTSRVWNYNVLNETDKGFKNVVVDYSVDGVNWTQLGGNYSWPIASGSSDYGGFGGPNFNNQLARYVLVSATQNWGDPSCAGFSKLTIDGTLCNPKDTPCDDGDPLTTYDKFDDNCNCRGVDINCGSDTLKLETLSLATGAYRAKKRLETQSLVPNNNNVIFSAGNSIVMLPGFKSNTSAVFSANIEDCIRAAYVQNEAQSEVQSLEKEGLIAEESKTENTKKIVFRVNEPSQVKLVLKDGKGQEVITIIDRFYENLGTQTKLIPIQKLADGTYVIELTIGAEVLKETFVVGNGGK